MAYKYKYYDLDWSRLFQRSCKSRFKNFQDKGRCELKQSHEGAHAKERGMYWIRWDSSGFVWLTTPGSSDQHLNKSGEFWRNELRKD